MRIFVTGATGVVGRRVVPVLAQAGHEVTAVARSSEKASALERIGASPIAVSLFDAAGLREAIAGHQVVINLATAVPKGMRMMLPGGWRGMDRIRRDASKLIVEAAIAGGVERLIQEAFAPIYEDARDRWVDEGWPMRPARYNRSVLDAERSAARFTAAGQSGVVLRFGYFYGPDPGGATHAAIAAVKRGWAPWFGSPDGYLPALTHDDAASAVVAALGVPSGTYNIVDDEPLTRRENFGALAAALGVAPPKFMPAWMSHLAGSIGETLARSLRISNRRFRDAAGWAPRYPSAREGWPAVVADVQPDRD